MYDQHKIEISSKDELEELETDLKGLYDEYCIKFRNSIYLESLLEEIQKEQPQKQQFNNVIRYFNILLLQNYHNRSKMSVVYLFIDSYYCC